MPPARAALAGGKRHGNAGVDDQLRDEAPFGDVMSAADYRKLFDTLVHEGEVREPGDRHPLVAFYGHREAREMVADVVIMGGLTDGIWPAGADPDPWLNRKMRRDAGLLLPERQIGLAAHDFQQAIAAKEVILTRAVRDAEAETVPSRWLNRLCNLMEGLPERTGQRRCRNAQPGPGVAGLRPRDGAAERRAIRRPAVAARAPPQPAAPGGSAAKTAAADPDFDPDPRPLCDLRPICAEAAPA